MNNDYKKIMIEDLNLSVKSENILTCAKITDFEQLLNHDLDKVRNMTKRCKKEIEEKIKIIINN